jgi:aspartate racemase
MRNLVANKRIGIVAGIGPSATVLYYQDIVEEYQKRKGDQHFPEMVIHSLDFAEVNRYLERGEWEVLTDQLVGVIEGLQRAGCEFGLFACNALHLVFDQVQQRVSLPMLSIIQSVLQEIKKQEVRKVGLIGTTFVMQYGLYLQPLEQAGIECLVPEEREQVWIMKAIKNDLQQHPVPKQTISRLVKDVMRLVGRGAEGVILGCTDLPIAITERNTPVLLFDSTRIHVKAILDCALVTEEGMEGSDDKRQKNLVKWQDR